MSRELHALENRLLNAIGRGVLTSVDDSRGLQIVELDGMPGEELKDVERIQNYGFTSHPKEGSQAVLVFPQGDRGHGIVVAMDDMGARLKDLAQGDVAVHDGRGNVVKLTEDGIEVEAAESAVVVTAATEVTIQAAGSVTVQAAGSAKVQAGGAVDLEAGGAASVKAGSVDIEAGAANIAAGAVSIEASLINLIGLLLINGVPFIAHTHLGVQQGSDETLGVTPVVP